MFQICMDTARDLIISTELKRTIIIFTNYFPLISIWNWNGKLLLILKDILYYN